MKDNVLRFEIENNGAYGIYHVHFLSRKYDHIVEFEVYPVSDWTGINDTKGTDYYCLESSDNKPFEQGKVLMSFYGSLCWRGVWESRLYFPDGNEYSSEELREVVELWTSKLEPMCKVKIKASEPELNYD